MKDAHSNLFWCARIEAMRWGQRHFVRIVDIVLMHSQTICSHPHRWKLRGAFAARHLSLSET